MTAPVTLGRADLVQRIHQHREEQGPRARVALVLHPGGAAGAYQAGALQALAEAGVRPDLIVGTSIGAFNALGFWLDELVGRAPGMPARATRLGRLWRRLGHRGQASRLLLDKPWLLGWITGRPDWSRGLASNVVAHLAAFEHTVATLQGGIFSTERLEAFTCRIISDALGLAADIDPARAGEALVDAARMGAGTGHRPPDLLVVATDVAAHAPTTFVLGDVATARALAARGWDAHTLGEGACCGAGALDVFYASASIPAVFPPRELRLLDFEATRPLVDGVIGNNRPFQLAQDAGATLIISLEVEAAMPGGPYPVASGSAHFVMAAAEAFMTIGDHFVRESARELALINRALARGADTHELVVPLYRLAPARRRLGLLDFDGHYEDGRLVTSLFDDFMFGYAEAGGDLATTWRDYLIGHARHGDTGSAVAARGPGLYLDTTFEPVGARPGVPHAGVARLALGMGGPG